MLKQLLAALALAVATSAFAVDVNKSSAQELTQVKGIGPAIAERIVTERKKGGDFKNWPDLVARVKGIGHNTAEKFSANGLTINGQALKHAKPNTPAQTTKNTVQTIQNPKNQSTPTPKK